MGEDSYVDRQVDLIVTAGRVVTMDDQRRVLQDAGVAIVGSDIVAVGPSVDLEKRFRARRRIDSPRGLMTPGLVDAHNHPIDYLAKGLCDDQPQFLRLKTRVFPYENALTDEEAHVASLGTFVEMIRHGTTCFGDGAGPQPGAVVRAARDIGIRGAVAMRTFDMAGPFGLKPPPTEQVIAASAEFVATYDGTAGGLIRACYDLDMPAMVSDELIAQTRELAEQGGHCILGHFIGTRAPDLARSGRNPELQRYSSRGVLGPRLTLAHIGWLPPEDIELLAATRTNIAHCPSMSLFGGCGWVTHGVMPDLITAGANIALGSDAAVISRSLDFVRIMYLASCAHKDARANPELLPAAQVFEMATRHGAIALGLGDRIGSLEVGKAADLVVFDTSEPHWMPRTPRSAIGDLVYNASGQDADTVVINGRVILANHSFVDFDVAALDPQVGAATTAVLNRIGIWPN